MATVLDTKPFQLKLGNFAGGVNLRDSPNNLSPDEVRKGENVMLDERGGGTKRLGCQSQGTFGVGEDRIISIHTYYRGVLQPQVLIHTSAGKLYYTADPGANPVTWTQITGASLSLTVPLSFETFNNKVYMADGVSNYASWDGSTYVTYPSAPKGRYLKAWKDTMFMSGFPTSADRVYESAAADAETWPVSNWVDLGKGDGDFVTGLATDGIFLIIPKREKIFVMYDPVSLANRLADPDKGAESHFSWVHFDAQLYFLSRRGVCQWRGDAEALPVSFKVDPLFRPDILNLNAMLNAYGYTIDTKIGWALPEAGQTTPTLQLEFFPRIAARNQPGPFVFQRIPAGVFTRYRWGATERLYGGHNAANKLLWVYAPVGTDDGTPFQALMETGMMDMSEPGRTKYIRRVRFLGRGNFGVQILRNFETSAHSSYSVDLHADVDVWDPINDIWNEGEWGPDSTVKEKLVNTDVYGRYIAFRFLESETNTGSRPIPVGSREYSLVSGEWAIFGFLIEGAVLGDRE